MDPAPTDSSAGHRPHRRRGPVVLMVIGGLLMVAGATAFVLGSVLVGSRVAESASGLLDLRAQQVLELPVPSRDEVRLEDGRYQVVAYGPQLVRRVAAGGDGLEAAPFVEPDVTVTGPDGTRLPVEKASSTILSRSSAGGAVVIGNVSVSDPGSHRVDVRPGGPAVTSVGLRPSPDLGETVRDTIGPGLTVVGGIITGGLGVLLLIGGIVWFGAADRSRSVPIPPPPGYGPPSG